MKVGYAKVSSNTLDLELQKQELLDVIAPNYDGVDLLQTSLDAI